MRMVQPSILAPPMPEGPQKKKDDLEWLRPIGTAASMFGFPYLSMAIGAYDMANGNPYGAMSFLGAGNGFGGGGNPFLNMLQRPGLGGGMPTSFGSLPTLG